MKIKIARRILNKNKWKLATIRIKDNAERSNSEKHLLKQSEKAEKIINENIKKTEGLK